ncbi:MAG: glutathione S-transferase [Proteobacteria bacterium]|nr:glutathione S-transferase [Pseudomonadota bacterium]
MSYRLYVFDISYFSGKMEAYLRYKGVDYERVEPSWGEISTTIQAKTGWMKMPVVETPDGRWLQDSTPMIDWFEERFPERPVVPSDPVQEAVVRLLEDYADEWMWRPALHYRWSYDKDALLYARRFREDFLHDVPFPDWVVKKLVLFRQRRTYVTHDGVQPDTVAHVEGIYTRTLDTLETILSDRPFLLGDSPSLLDFGFFASMFRHFSLDPTPSRIMRERAPAVYLWVARLWSASASETPQWEEGIPEAWAPLLQDCGEAYLEYQHANAVAVRDGEPHFDFSVQGTTYRNLPAVPYRAWCRQRVQGQITALAAQDDRVQPFLEAHGCWEPLFRDGAIDSGVDEALDIPERQPRSVGWGAWVKGYLWGTHWRPRV